uniref:VWFA domain-containing protein n=1 Tax=Strongyloides stercoralis TaxID=6248 RepID=A0A0K0E1A1_STRER
MEIIFILDRRILIRILLVLLFILTLSKGEEVKFNEWVKEKDSIDGKGGCSPTLPIQVVFLIDITNHNVTCFEEQKEKLIKTLDFIQLAGNGRNISIGLVAFHRRPILIIDLNSKSSYRDRDIRRQIKNIKPRKRTIDPYPAGGMEYAKDMFMKSYISNAKRLIVLGHNGNSNDLMSDTLNIKNNLEKLKVDIFVVTGGDHIRSENLIYYVESERRILRESFESYSLEIENSLDYCEEDFGLQVLEMEKKKKYRIINRKMFASKIKNLDKLNLDDGKFKCDSENVDLIILLDTTGISKNNFENEKKMVLDLIGRLHEDLFDSEVLQIAIISFCDIPTIHLPFNLGKNKKQDILKAIENIEFTGNSTLISEGINVAVEEFNRSLRRKTKQFLVLISDGHGKEYWHKVKSTSKKLNEYGYEVYAASNSNNYNAIELRMYTGGNKDRVFVGRRVKNFINQLLNDMDKCFSNSPNIKLQAELNRGLTSTKPTTTTVVTTTETTTTTTTTLPPTTTTIETTTELSLAVILERGIGKFVGNADCKQDAVDIMIILDVSTSITDVFDRQKQVILDLLQIPNEKDFKNRIRVGLVTFNHEAKLIFHLEKYKNKEDILSSIVKIKHTGGQTSLLSGVERAMQELITYKKESKTKLVTLIISDGNSRDNWYSVVRGGKKLRDLGCVVYSVTASDYYHFNELKEYAGSSDRVFTNGYTPKFIKMASEFLFGCTIDEDDFVKEKNFQEVSLINTNENSLKSKNKGIFNEKINKTTIVKENNNKISNEKKEDKDTNDDDDVFDFTNAPLNNRQRLTSISGKEDFLNEGSGEEIVHPIEGHLIEESSGEEIENTSKQDNIKIVESSNEKIDINTHLEVRTTQNPIDKKVNNKQETLTKNQIDSRHETFIKLSKKFNITETETSDDEEGKANLRGQTIFGQSKNISRERLNKFASERHDEYDESVEELSKVDTNDSAFGKGKERQPVGGVIDNENKENLNINNNNKNRKLEGVHDKNIPPNTSTNNDKNKLINTDKEQFLTVESSAIEIIEKNNDTETEKEIFNTNNTLNLSKLKTLKSGCKIDLLFVIDSSQSVDNSFEKQIQLAIDLIKQIPSQDFEDRIKVGALAFTSTCQTQFEIGQYKNKKDIMEELIKIKHLGGSTSVVSGLKRAIKTFKRDGRRDALQIIILLSDGNSFDNWRDVIKTASSLRKIDSTLFAISLSQNYYLSELELYAGNKWYVYVDGRIRQFLSDAETIIQRCTGPTIPKENSKIIKESNESVVKENNVTVIKNTTILSITNNKKNETKEDFDLTNLPVIKNIETVHEIRNEETINLRVNKPSLISNKITNSPQNDQECSNDLVDLIILLDVSASIVKEFYEEKNFVSDLIKVLPGQNFEYRFRTSLITFNKNAKKILSLGEEKTRNDILYEIDRIMQASGATSLTSAVRMALEDVRSYKRPTSRLVTVIVSDGNSQDEWDDVLRMSKELKNTIGKDIYAVTLSQKYYYEELKEYTGNDNNIFVDEKINNFMRGVGQIILGCKENPNPLITMAPEETVQPTPPTTDVVEGGRKFTTIKSRISTVSDIRFPGFIDNEDGENKTLARKINNNNPLIISKEEDKAEEVTKEENDNEKGKTTTKSLPIKGKRIFSAEVIERETGKVGRIVDEVKDFKAKDAQINYDTRNAISFGVSSHETKEANNLKCHYKKMDIIVILDASSSRKEVFDAQRELTLSLIEKLPISKENNDVALGIISFTSQAFLREPLSIGKSKDELRRVVENIEYIGGSTATSEGILLAISEIELKRRNDAFQVVVLMNDGMSQDDWSIVESTATKLHSTGAHVVGVAMGNDVDYRELNLYVSEKENMFKDNQTEAFLNSITNLLDNGVKDKCHKYESIIQSVSQILMSNDDNNTSFTSSPSYTNPESNGKKKQIITNYSFNFSNFKSQKYFNDDNIKSKMVDLSNLQEIHEENTESCSLPDIDLVVIFDTAAPPNSTESDMVQQNRYLLTDLIGSLPVNNRLKMSIITFEGSPTIIHEFSNEQDKKHLYMACERIVPKDGTPSYSKAIDGAYEYYVSKRRPTARGMFLIVGDGKTPDEIESRSFSANTIRRDKNLNCYALHSGVNMDRKGLKRYTGDENKIYDFKRNTEFMDLLIKKIKAGDSENCRRAKAVLNKNDTTINDQIYLTLKEKYPKNSSLKDTAIEKLDDILVTKSDKLPIEKEKIDDESCLVDLMLLIDTSTSVKSVFRKVLNVASNIVNKLKVGENNAHVSIIQISSDAETKVTWKFNSPQNKTLIIRSIINTKYRGGPSSIYKGLKIASNEYKLDNGARINKATPVAVIFSDGFDHNNLVESSNLLREVIPNVYAITITDEFPYNLPELEKITDNPNRVFTSENLNDFFSIFKQYTVNC